MFTANGATKVMLLRRAHALVEFVRKQKWEYVSTSVEALEPLG